MFLSRLLPPPQATGVCQDIMDVILPSMKVEDLAERIKVRQGLLGGPLKLRLDQLSTLLVRHESWAWAAGGVHLLLPPPA